jgi:iron(III) transport system ATP-binding protein
MGAIEIDRLVKHYGSVIGVDGITFEVNEGELVSLLGPSGCGKSTTLRSIAGLERITDGEIRITGRVCSSAKDDVHMEPAERELGMVFQSFALWPNMTVLENVRFGLEQKDDINLSKQEMNERAQEYLDLVDLGEYADSIPGELSGGEQQRVALARALVYEPGVMLLDEPLSNLDAKLRKEARIWLKRIQEETEVTTLYVTHDQAEASALSDRMVILNEGEIEQIGTPEEVFKQPDNHFVADFLGKENFIDGTLSGFDGTSGTVTTEEGESLAVSVNKDGFSEGQSVSIAISPEEIELSRNGDGTNIIEGTIDQKLYYGDKTEIVIQASGGREIIVVVVDIIPEDEGDDVRIELPESKCALLPN